MNDTTAIKTWFTVTDAAAYANVCRDTIYDACEHGQLQHVRIGGRRAIRLRAEWIDAWLAQYAVAPVVVPERDRV
jgi:excisionase family DNA binding protein